ncbi:3-keto-5-aminohexanoate cleavage protein [Rhizobium lusitanum]|uniref:3-keto-5-aminohexanoate cleavage protein n=1 Tax=Rhizobium lusitanum TaxID=293958 RepID=UPI00195E331E|nr:3-keto-5-aminohexanoate cleavage protein [Rhizobium lusitanum]MBM7045570.1 3-keto-5-aminohexanoate cleavage protein [Rhizobium lusitanum]
MSVETGLNSVAIAVAPNGGRKTKVDHPNLPLTATELAETAVRCKEAGAAMIHVHIRKKDGSHLLDAGAYREVMSAIRSRAGDDLVVQITSEALGLYTPPEQIAVVKETRPEAVSLALRELVPDASFEAAFGDLLLWMSKERVFPQIILYDPSEAVLLADLQKRGLIPWRTIPVLFVLGRYTVGQTSHPTDLLPFLATGIPRFEHWSVCAFGRHEVACVTAGTLLGGHMRVGFENNMRLPDGTTASGNEDLVRTASQVVRAVNYELESGCDLRKRLRNLAD